MFFSGSSFWSAQEAAEVSLYWQCPSTTRLRAADHGDLGHLPRVLDLILSAEPAEQTLSETRPGRKSIRPAECLQASAILGGITETKKAFHPPAHRPRAVVTLLDHIQVNLRRRAIIIVPAATTQRAPSATQPYQQSLLRIDNANDFFEKGKLIVDAKDGTRQDGDASPASGCGRRTCSVSLGLSSRPVKFVLADSSQTYKFDAKDWSAVVAICLSGAEWQTRGWPIGEDVAELAEKHKVFFFSYVDTSLPKVATLSSNITVLLFQRSFRHADGALMKQFWEEVSEHLQSPAPPGDTGGDAKTSENSEFGLGQDCCEMTV